jgi:general secretion pathway protein D
VIRPSVATFCCATRLAACALVVSLALASAPALAQTAPAPAAPPAMLRARASSITSPLVPAQELTQLVALKYHYGFQPLPGTPNPLVTVIAGRANTIDALNNALSKVGLETYIDRGVLYLGTPSTIDVQFNTGKTMLASISISGMSPASVAENISSFVKPGVAVWADNAHQALVVRGTKAEIDQLRAAVDNVEAVGYTTARYRMVNAIPVDKVVAMVQAMDPSIAPDAVVADANDDALLIRGTQSYVSRVTSDLQNFIDRPTDAVMYDATIYEVDPEAFQENLGLILGQSQTNYSAVGQTTVASPSAPTQGQAIFGFPINRSLNVSGQLNLLESHGEAKVLRRITLTASNGSQAQTQYTEDYPFPVTDQYTGVVTIRSVTTGVTFKITPIIGKSSIMNDIYADFSDIIGTGAQGAPIVSHRTSSTMVPTYGQDDGILVTGLYAWDTNTTRTGVMPFDRIPLIGGLFRNKQANSQRIEIVTVLFPHVLPHESHAQVPVLFPHIPQGALQSPIESAPTPTPGPVPTPTPAAALRLQQPVLQVPSVPSAPTPSASPKG